MRFAACRVPSDDGVGRRRPAVNPAPIAAMGAAVTWDGRAARMKKGPGSPALCVTEDVSRLLLLGFFLLGFCGRRCGSRSRGIGGLGRIRRRGSRRGRRRGRRRGGRSGCRGRRGRLFSAGGEHGNDHRSKEQRLLHFRFPFEAARGPVWSDRRAALLVWHSNAAIAVGADYSRRAATTAALEHYLERGITVRAVRPAGCARPRPSGDRTAPPTFACAARD